MDNQIKAETILDFPVYQEFQRSYTYSNALTVAARIVLILTSVYYICQFDSPMLLFGFVLISAVYLITQLIQNRRGGNTQYKRMLASNNGKPNHFVLQFREEDILDTNQDSGNVYTYRYDQIRQLINTPKLLLVVLQYRLCVIIDKEKITGGTPEELMDFLLQRSPNMKKKKVQTIAFGKWVSRILNTVLVLGCIWALLNIPGFSVMERLSGKLPNSMSYREMAVELEDLGICITDQTLEELEAYDADYLAQYGKEFYRDNPRASKVQDLLYWEGSGQTDQETLEWTPSQSGIYWMDLEVWNVSAMYTDFLTGLDAMSDGITIANLREDHTDADPENGTGNVDIYFDLNGTRHSLDAWSNYDWFDTEVVVQLGEILEADQDPGNLYVSYDGGQGLYFFYSGEAAAKELSRLTGLTFCPASQLYTLF